MQVKWETTNSKPHLNQSKYLQSKKYLQSSITPVRDWQVPWSLHKCTFKKDNNREKEKKIMSLSLSENHVIGSQLDNVQIFLFIYLFYFIF
jgi:hypothetical protein